MTCVTFGVVLSPGASHDRPVDEPRPANLRALARAGFRGIEVDAARRHERSARERAPVPGRRLGSGLGDPRLSERQHHRQIDAVHILRIRPPSPRHSGEGRTHADGVTASVTIPPAPAVKLFLGALAPAGNSWCLPAPNGRYRSGKGGNRCNATVVGYVIM